MRLRCRRMLPLIELFVNNDRGRAVYAGIQNVPQSAWDRVGSSAVREVWPENRAVLASVMAVGRAYI